MPDRVTSRSAMVVADKSMPRRLDAIGHVVDALHDFLTCHQAKESCAIRSSGPGLVANTPPTERSPLACCDQLATMTSPVGASSASESTPFPTLDFPRGRCPATDVPRR
jgi:hypothetical protein